MPTVAELRERAKGGPAPLPKETEIVTLVEGQHLLSSISALAREKQDLELQVLQRASEPDSAPPLKAGEKGPAARLEMVKEAIGEKQAALGAHQGIVGLTGMLAGDWQRWKDEHPPRQESQADDQLTGGFCNSTDLMATLGKFVTSWDGEDLEPGAWNSWLSAMVATADHSALVSAVVSMHERRVRPLPKSSTDSSSTLTSETESTSPST